MKPLLCFLVFALLSGTATSQSGMLTARQHYDAVRTDVVSKHGDDARLFMVMALYNVGGMPVTLDSETGKAAMWMYAFLSPSDQQLVTGVAVDNDVMGTMIGEIGAQAWPDGADLTYSALHQGRWLDSDSAALIWRTMAVKDFLDSRAGSYPIGFLMTLASGDPASAAQWAIVAVDGMDTISCTIDAIAATPIDCSMTTGISDVSMASDFQLGDIHPNPVHMGESASFTITGSLANRLRIDVFDNLGRHMGVVLDADVTPGIHPFVIPAELIRSPGIYFVQARSNSGIATKKVLVLR
jgi:hypothetical protein